MYEEYILQKLILACKDNTRSYIGGYVNVMYMNFAGEEYFIFFFSSIFWIVIT